MSNVNNKENTSNNSCDKTSKAGKQGNRSRNRGRSNAKSNTRKIEEGKKASSRNDVAWYSRNAELLKSAASLPFAPIVGESIDNRWTVPGVMSLEWSPAFGSGVKPIALNQASDSMYSYIVHANSRNYNYTAPDLMVLTIAGMQVFSIIGTMIRAYGTVKYYTERNYYVPDAILRAMGFDPVDFRSNLGQIWFDINNLIDQSRQIWVPNTFPLMERWFWLNSSVFKDSENDVYQIYVPVQSTFFMFSETKYATGSALVTATNAKGESIDVGASNKWAKWKSVAQNMIDQLVYSEDRGMIYGDILNAYGQDKLYALPSLDSNYVVSPVYNAEFLMQVENTTVYPKGVSGLIQSEEDLYPLYALDEVRSGGVAPGFGLGTTAIVNTHLDRQPTPEEIMIATRNMVLGTTAEHVYVPDTTAGIGVTPVMGYAWIPDTVGSEIFTKIKLWRRYADGSQGIDGSEFLDYKTPSSNMRFMAFDWHPFLYRQVNSSLPTAAAKAEDVGKYPIIIGEAFGDYDNYTVVDHLVIRKLHDAAMFSLFGVPQI